MDVYGRYELIARIATGGMAEIFQARAVGIEGFEKLVVLKRILPELNDDQQYIDMFLDEARVAAQLNHPNIAEVYDIGREDERYFFTMEHVHGQNLNRILRTGHLTTAEAVTIVIGAAAGLHHAHEKLDYQGRPLSIVHRDVSPSNVLVRYDGCVKVVDFGIAKAASQHAHTRVGTLKGKLAYMSPEQVRGRAIDRRSDVFSLGIVLWELTCGRKLFRSSDDHALLRLIADSDAPPPSLYVKDYPPGLESIVMCALSRDRERRYPTAEAMQLALESFAREHRIEVSQVLLARLMNRLFPDHPATPLSPDPDRTMVEPLEPIDLELELPESQKTQQRQTPLPPPRRSRAGMILLAALTTLGLLALAVWMAVVLSRG